MSAFWTLRSFFTAKLFSRLSSTEVAGRGQSPKEQRQGEIETGRERGKHIRAYERLREELSPAYEALLKNVVAESDDGVRFVVDLRQVPFFLGRSDEREVGFITRLVVRY